MFENFGQEPSSPEGRGRRSASALLSLGIFAGLAAAVGAAMTTHHLRTKQREREMEVTFEALPQMKAPKPKLVAQPGPKKKKKPAKLHQITEIPDERPEEAEGELTEAEDTGAIDGVIEEGSGGGGGPVVAAPPPEPPAEPPPERRSEQVRETIQAPVYVSGCRAPDIPDALHSQAQTIRVEVRMLVGADGAVKKAKVLQSHPLIPDSVILECASAQRFKPAQLPDGTEVPYPYRRRFVFKPAQA